jgi:hypothetical protein
VDNLSNKYRRGKMMNRKDPKVFTKEQELEICSGYFSEDKPNTYILAKRWDCSSSFVRTIIRRNGYKLRTPSEALKGRKVHNKGLTYEEEYGIEKAKEMKELVSVKTKEGMDNIEVKEKCGWSKGLTKETSGGVKNSSNSRKGLIPRNKGITLEKEFGIEKAEKIKQKISILTKEAFKNDPILKEKCGRPHKGKPSPMKDRQHTPESRENIKKGMANRDPEDRKRWIESLSGENNGNWLGGLKYMPYGFNFNPKLKEKIRNRDGNICQLCFLMNEENKEKYGKSLHAHHIDYDKQNCTESNLVSLCNVCNGKVNKDRKKWTNYFQTLISVLEEQKYLMELYANF